MFTLEDLNPLSFTNFLREKFELEFSEWVPKKQKELEKPPEVAAFDLEGMVAKARSSVAASIANSPHSYASLPSGHGGRAMGFVTKEGYGSYCRLHYSTLGISILYADSMAVNAGSCGGVGSVFTLNHKSDPSWVPINPAFVQIGGFVCLRANLPKILTRFARKLDIVPTASLP